MCRFFETPKIYRCLSLLVILMAGASLVFAQMSAQDRERREIARLGLHMGQSQAVVKSLLAKGGYPLWDCNGSLIEPGIQWVNCLSAIRLPDSGYAVKRV